MYYERAIVIQGNHCSIFARQKKVRHFFVPFFFATIGCPLLHFRMERQIDALYPREILPSRRLRMEMSDGHARDASRIVGDGMAASLWLTPLFI